MRSYVALGLLWCAAVGCSRDAAHTPSTPPRTRDSVGTGVAAPVDPHSFAPGATFDTLMVRAQALALSPSEAPPDGACVLAARDRRVWLQAELLPAVSPLPGASADLSARLQRSVRPVRVLSAWGEPSPAPSATDIALAAFTALDASSRRLPFVAMFVTSGGVHLRHSQSYAEAEDGPLDLAALQVRLDALRRREPFVLYVTADASVALADMHTTMAVLPDTQPTALAVVLPEGTVLPVRESAADAARLACPDGLSEPATDAVEGELSAAQIMDAIAPLRVAAQRCLEQAAGPAAAGGKLTLALRIEASGVPGELCLVHDAIGDAVLASCVVESARALRLPAPQPAGFVDVHLPLSLAPISRPPPRPVCR